MLGVAYTLQVGDFDPGGHHQLALLLGGVCHCRIILLFSIFECYCPFVTVRKGKTVF